MTFDEGIEIVTKALDAAGVGVIVLGSLFATVVAATRLAGADRSGWYRSYRQDVGRAILLGLEFLVASDIVRTVTVSPTFSGVGVLALIVLIRTFLSVALELELSGRWPWQAPSPS